MRYIYLHGFASSPHSRKATLFVDRLRACGIDLATLDLAPDFRNLTLTGQLAIVNNAVDGQPAVLIGSSLGGYLSALFASTHPEVKRLLLLAPAFDFFELWRQKLGPEKLEDWRENGEMRVYHYGMGRETDLGFQIMEDAERYPGYPDFTQPCLILHGRQDSVVPLENSERFQRTHPASAKVISFDSGHDMTEVLPEIWNFSREFLLDENVM